MTLNDLLKCPHLNIPINHFILPFNRQLFPRLLVMRSQYLLRKSTVCEIFWEDTIQHLLMSVKLSTKLELANQCALQHLKFAGSCKIIQFIVSFARTCAYTVLWITMDINVAIFLRPLK